MANFSVVSALILLVVISSAYNVESQTVTLVPNFYAQTCKGAERAIKNLVADAVEQNPRVGAGMIRLLFHDCFVEGCDASILIASTGSAEIDAIPNQTLHSLDLIDKAKAIVEAVCPGIVSCADIIAFAAASSLVVLGGPNVEILGGRGDGLVSSESEANANIPSPFSGLSTLESQFSGKGLTVDDLVTLSGAHTVGKAHCGTFAFRLRNFSSTANVDPTLNPNYAAKLANECPVNFPSTAIVNNDPQTPTFFDNAYHQDVATKRGLFTSDASLYTAFQTIAIVNNYADNNGLFLSKFGAAMVKMGQIGVKPVSPGIANIRTKCTAFAGST